MTNCYSSQEGPFVDASVTAIPEWIMDTYEGLNADIVDLNANYGATMQRSHLETSRSKILDTASIALRRTPKGEESTALIMGPGGCFDIPLEEIVDAFDTTTLIDVETGRTEHALSSLPPRLLGKVVLHRSDITGRIAELGRAIETHAAKEYFDFIDDSALAVRALAQQSKNPNIPGTYSFSCSHLVASQITSLPVLGVSAYTTERYGIPLSGHPLGVDRPLTTALQDFAVTFQTDHIKHLAQVTKEQGTVHFADTIFKVVNGQELPMIVPDVLDEIDRHFDDLAQGSGWPWHVSPTTLFYIMSESLAPKSQAEQSKQHAN